MTTIITETDVNSLVSQAQGLYRKCAYRESLSLCETLYIKGPSNIDNLVLLGSIHFQLRNLSESIFYSQQCLRVDQTCAEAYVTIGNCMKEMGEIHTAISFFHKAIRFQPRFPDAYNNLGCTLFKLGRIHEAIETFNVATSLDESQCDAICNLANIYKATRRPNDAKNEYLRAIKISPQCAIAWSNLGGIFNDSGDFEQSLKCYQHALTIIPEFADAHSNMGNAMRNLGRKTKDKVLIDESSTKHKQAQELRPDFALATGNLALYHIQNKENKKKAEQLLRKASLQDPTFLDSLCNLSAMYFEQGRFDECVKMCLRVIKIKPEHYCAYHNLGNALKEKVRL
jgi:protein O-GlcNAc transferase